MNDDERETLWASDENEEDGGGGEEGGSEGGGAEESGSEEEEGSEAGEEEEGEDEETEGEDEDEEDEDESEEEEGEDEDEESDEEEDEDETDEDETDEEGDDEDESDDEDEESDDEEEEIVAVDDDVFGSAEDYENAEEADFVADDGEWSEEDYQASAARLFGENEFFGETVEDQLASEGYAPAEDEEIVARMDSIFADASTSVSFFVKDGVLYPVGFVPVEYIALILAEFPDADLSLLRTTVIHRVKPVKPGKLPSVLDKVDPKDTVDLRKYCSPIGDQGQTSRCAAFAWTHALEMANKIAGVSDERLSPTYSMLQFQKMQGDASDYEYAWSGGSGTIGGVKPGKVLIENGTCKQELWPDTSPGPAKKEEQLAKDASNYKLGARLVPVKLDDLRKVLSAGCPVELAMNTGAAFSTLGRDGIFKDAEPPKGKHGCHAMLIVGYIGNFYIVKNSWGTKWGDNGYCYMPRKVLAGSNPEFIAVMVGQGGDTEEAPAKAGKGKAGKLELGFCATLGWNEVKVIAGATLDLNAPGAPKNSPVNEEFFLYHTEPVEASGFCIHFKLPHYVTFQSSLDALRGAGKGSAAETAREVAAPLLEEEPA